jgi:ADP-dependent NAD(P)H-hydrate dehydratase / NAD(P)H-hydrate epimerase
MGHFIITPAEMYKAERAVFAAGRSSFALMQQAGQGVADLVEKHYPKGSIRVLCGPGGNGGDGFIAANRLASFGRSVSVYLLVPQHTLSGDCRQAFETWAGPVAPLSDDYDSREDITLDALFGGGLSRPLAGISADLARTSNAPIISVDVPSGLDGTTGEALGACFQASLTVTFAALRPAHVLSPGRQMCGKVEVLDIGVPVPQHTKYRVEGSAEDADVLSFQNVEGLRGLIEESIDPPENRIDAVRLAAVQSGRTIVLEAPDRILGRPSGEVIVSP